MTEAKKMRVHVRVKGRVQGVGFRAHVEYHARKLGVTGWVRNVNDDTVEAIAEGTSLQLQEFVEFMRKGPRLSRVDESKVDWEDATGEFDGFGTKGSVW